MKHPVLPIASAPVGLAPKPKGWPLLRLGFRPFYLGATAFGALAVPLCFRPCDVRIFVVIS